MKKIFSVVFSLFLCLTLIASTVHAQDTTSQDTTTQVDTTATAPTQSIPADSGVLPGMIGVFSDFAIGHNIPAGEVPTDPYLLDCSSDIPNLYGYLKKCPKDANGNAYSPGMLGVQAKAIAFLFENQISSQEYVADLLNN